MRNVFRLLAALTLLLTSCSFANRHTLVLWHSLDGARERALLTLIDQWNASGSTGVHVIAERRDSQAQHSAMLDVIDAAPAVRMPDLVLATPQQAAVYHQRDALQRLEGRLDGADGFKPNDRADIFPFVLNAGKTPAGELIGVPQGGNARVMLVNKRWLDSQGLLVPENWDQFERVCERVPELAPELQCIGMVADDVLLQEWLLAHGTRPLALDGSAQLGSGEVESVLAPLLAKRQINQAVLAVSEAQMRDAFAGGQLVFAFDWSAELRSIDKLSRDNNSADWVVAPLPTVSGVSASLQRAPLWVLPKPTGSAGNSQLAWRFLRWMLEQDQTAYWATATGELPARISSIGRLDSDRLPRGFLTVVQQVASRTQAEPLVAVWPCAREALGDIAQALLNTESVTATLAAGQIQLSAQLAGECPVR